MDKLTQNSIASLVIEAKYSSASAVHTDLYFCPSVNMWRDWFSDRQRERLTGCARGETVVLEEAYVHSRYDAKLAVVISREQWQPPDMPGGKIKPRMGRWYPQGFVRGVTAIYSQTTAPMRIIGLEEDGIVIDCNHPMAEREITVSATVQQTAEPAKERGGRCAHWLEEILTDGPGMQILPRGHQPDYGEEDGFRRADEADDALFYDRPRMVQHIDAQALDHLRLFTSNLIGDGSRVLDLMSSMESHLASEAEVIGLGMNEEEMIANPKLTRRLVHDLNTHPDLPFEDGRFDVICCHLSFEYLLYPQRVMAECGRVLRQGGDLLISFSNRWFPGKVTLLWQRLHEFERMGFVSACLPPAFSEIKTITYRNWPRPAEDAHYGKLQTGDPLYLVVARRR